MDAAVPRADDLQKPLDIGALELGQLAVFQNRRDDRMQARELFEHVHIGRVAGLGLFLRGQAELFKQHLAQLAGGVDVEFAARVLVDLPDQHRDARVQLVAEGAQLVRRDRAAEHLHLREHAQERQLDLVIQPAHAELLDLVRGLGVDRADGADVLRAGRHGLLLSAERRDRRRVVQIERGQLGIAVGERDARQVVARLGRVDQIGRDTGVEFDALRVHAAREQRRDGGLGVVQDELDRAVEQAAQDGVPIRIREIVREQHVRRIAVQQAERAQRFGHEREHPVGGGQRIQQRERLSGRPDALRRDRGQAGRGALAAQAQTLDEVLEFQPGQQLIERGLVHFGRGQVFHIQLERRAAVDGREPVAVLRRLRAGFQLGAHALFDPRVVQMRVHAVQRAEIVQQLQRGLFAHARHAGDVVRRVAHQRLEVDQIDRVKAVFFAELFGIIGLVGGLPHAGRDQAHGRPAADQLQAVPVAGDDDAAVAVLVRAAADRADQVVRLVARQLAAHEPHRVQHFLHHRQLGGELIRHALAGGLIGIKLQMAEGFFLYVKAHDRAVGLLVVLQLEQRGQKAVDRVGGQALVVGELPHAVKRAVQNAVAVYHHDLHAPVLIIPLDLCM